MQPTPRVRRDRPDERAEATYPLASMVTAVADRFVVQDARPAYLARAAGLWRFDERKPLTTD